MDENIATYQYLMKAPYTDIFKMPRSHLNLAIKKGNEIRGEEFKALGSLILGGRVKGMGF